MFDLDTVSFLSFSGFLKATPREEGGDRLIYVEASNEALDQQGEVILAKALQDSAGYYLQYGNLDMDHITQTGPRAGVPNYAAFEIGRPLEVNVQGGTTFVKGLVYRGEGPVAAQANTFWDSITKLNPPQAWYPSVGGAVLAKSQEFDPATRQKRTLVNRVRWTNIGFSKTPVNQTVGTVSTVPIASFAKAWGAGGLDLGKALETGAGTDVATLTGGGALAKQSLDRKVQSYWDLRERLSADMRKGRCGGDAKSMAKHCQDQYGLGPDEAAEGVEDFIRDLHRARKLKPKGTH